MINEELEKKWDIIIFSEDELDNIIKIFESNDPSYEELVYKIRKILNTDYTYNLIYFQNELERFNRYLKRCACVLIGLDDENIKKEDIHFPNAVYIKKFYKVYTYILNRHHANPVSRLYELPYVAGSSLSKSLNDLSDLYNIIILDTDEKSKIEAVYNFFEKKDIDSFFQRFILLKNLSVFDENEETKRYVQMLDFVYNFVRQNLTNKTIEEFKNRAAEDNLYNKYIRTNAHQYIRAFIDGDDKYDLFKFCRNNCITIYGFKYRLKLVKDCEPDLYKEYTEVIDSIQKDRFVANCKVLESLARDIDECESKGSNFDIIEFYTRVPFKSDKENFGKKLKYFLSSMDNKKATYTLYKYIGKNKIDKIYFTSKDNELKKLSQSEISYGEKKYTPEIVEKVFKYMDIMGYPYLSRIYDKLMVNYMTGNLDIDSFIEKQEQYESEDFSR